MMQLRVRIPSVLYRRRLTAAGTNRRLTEVLVEALQDEGIFDTLLSRTAEDHPPAAAAMAGEIPCDAPASTNTAAGPTESEVWWREHDEDDS
jgi:hypothetical protein